MTTVLQIGVGFELGLRVWWLTTVRGSLRQLGPRAVMDGRHMPILSLSIRIL